MLKKYAAHYGPEKCFPSRLTIAKKLKTSEKTVSRAISVLIGAGEIERIPHGQHSTQYRILRNAKALSATNVPAEKKSDAARVPAAQIRVIINTPFEIQGVAPKVTRQNVPAYLSTNNPQSPLETPPAYYTTSQEIELWRQAQHWLSTHPQLFVGPGDIGRVMHAIEDHGPEVQYIPGLSTKLELIDRKPAASAGLNNLARSVGGSE